MKKARRFTLQQAMHDGCCVRFTRECERGRVSGYVLDVGPKFFLLAVICDGISFDGFCCYRVRDVLGLRVDPYAAFVEAALGKRGERKPKKPRVDVASIDDLLLSAGRAFPLVAISLEMDEPGTCWIGRVVGIERGWVGLHEINPDASWDPKPNAYRLSRITRIGFGGDYEEALQLVGGKKPPK